MQQLKRSEAALSAVRVARGELATLRQVAGKRGAVAAAEEAKQKVSGHLGCLSEWAVMGSEDGGEAGWWAVIGAHAGVLQNQRLAA